MKRRAPLGWGHPDDWEGDWNDHLRAIRFRKLAQFFIPLLAIVVGIALLLGIRFSLSW